jgi:hypothetical protein
MEQKIRKVLKELAELLIQKNKKYGNSALEPIRIFSNANPIEQLKIRIDDKLSRVSQGFGEDPDEDTLLDLMGYLVLLRIAQNEQKDSTTSDDHS